jgi:uncharacterized membrane protein
MKTLCAGLVMLSLAVLAGCGGSSTGSSEKHVGGPGAGTSASQKEPLFGAGENEFKLSTPLTATHLKQGESKQLKIGIDRGKNFDEDVTLKFEGSPDVPKGVTFDPASPTIKHGDKEAVFTVKAADEAALGDFKIKVIGKPSKGKEAVNTLELKIEKKG